MRELAAGAGVNVNTARAIYRRLEQEELVVSRHGQGTFVVPDVATSPALEQVAADAAESARALGIDPRDLARTLYAGSAPSDAARAAPLADPEPALAEPSEEDARAARRALRGQIARLEAQLAAYPEDAAGRESPRRRPSRSPGRPAGSPTSASWRRFATSSIDRLKRVREQVEQRGERRAARPAGASTAWSRTPAPTSGSRSPTRRWATRAAPATGCGPSGDRSGR